MKKINYSKLIYPTEQITIGDLTKPKPNVIKIYHTIKKKAIKAGIIKYDQQGGVVYIDPF